MAISAAAVAKAATALSDGKARKIVGKVCAAALAPLALIIVLLCALLSGGAEHNNNALDLCLYGGTLTEKAPQEYQDHLAQIQTSFALIDTTSATVSRQMDAGNSLDSTRVKAIFHVLFSLMMPPPMLE